MLFSKPTLIGHRGLSAFAPENTMESFKIAADSGLQWVEFDVQLTFDNELAVIHDETLDRTTNGTGWVCDWRWSDIQALKPAVPHLKEVLTWSQQSRCHLNIEIKGLPELRLKTVQKLLSELINFPDLPPFVVSSFDHLALSYYQDQKGPGTIGYLMEKIDWAVIENLNPQQHLIHCEWQQSPETFEGLAGKGFRMLVYTVNDPNLARKLYSQGVKGIFSDCLSPQSLL